MRRAPELVKAFREARHRISSERQHREDLDIFGVALSAEQEIRPCRAKAWQANSKLSYMYRVEGPGFLLLRKNTPKIADYSGHCSITVVYECRKAFRF